jgi:prolycopene isomerase
MSQGFKNSIFSGQFNTVQLGRFRPRSQKHRILSVEPVQTSVFSGYIVPRNIKSKIDSLGEVKLNKDFILRSKAVLTVDKEVDIEGNEGVSRERSDYDVIVIGSGIVGLVAATQLAVKGAKVLVLEKYVIPGGSSGYYERDGYTFDVGSSVMFGFSDKVSCYCSFIFLYCCYLRCDLFVY